MRQFIIKSADEPYNVGAMTLKLKNVLMEGDPAPDWEATAYDGEKLSLSDSRGQFVLMDFWATWCGPCLAELPNLEAAHEEFGGDRLAVIGLSVDETIDLPQAFLQKKPSAYSQGFLDGDHYLAIAPSPDGCWSWLLRRCSVCKGRAVTRSLKRPTSTDSLRKACA